MTFLSFFIFNGYLTLQIQQHSLFVIFIHPLFYSVIFVSFDPNHSLRQSKWMYSIDPLHLQGFIRIFYGLYDYVSQQILHRFYYPLFTLLDYSCDYSILESRSRIKAGSSSSFSRSIYLILISSISNYSLPNLMISPFWRSQS